MTEAVPAHRFMLAAIASGTVMMPVALIILFDFAWARVRQRPYLMPVAYAYYACLTAAASLLARAFHFHGFWFSIVLPMLAGYLLAPHVNWRLCVAGEEPKNTVDSLHEPYPR